MQAHYRDFRPRYLASIDGALLISNSMNAYFSCATGTICFREKDGNSDRKDSGGIYLGLNSCTRFPEASCTVDIFDPEATYANKVSLGY